MAGILSMSCSACGHTIFAADARSLGTGVRRHVEDVCAAQPAEPAFLEALRRLRSEPPAVVA